MHYRINIGSTWRKFKTEKSARQFMNYVKKVAKPGSVYSKVSVTKVLGKKKSKKKFWFQ